MTDVSMVRIPGGRILVGSDVHYPEERPAHDIDVPPLWIDRTSVTNRDFAEFVAQTGWVTTAEKAATPGSLVFRMTSGPVDLHNPVHWWSFAPGANWRCPGGPGTGIAGLEDHPVVHIARSDAEAFAAWRGARLPNEWEWEAACRGGLRRSRFCLGRGIQSQWRIAGQYLDRRLPVVFRPRRPPRDLCGRCLRIESVWTVRHDRKCLGMDVVPICRRRLLQPRYILATRSDDVARRLVPVCRGILSALSTGGADRRRGRRHDQPYRVSLCAR